MDNLSTRPWGVKALTGLMALQSIMLLTLGLLSGQVSTLVIAGFAGLITFALYKGKNWAWALIILANALAVLGSLPVITNFSTITATSFLQALLSIPVLVIALIPTTRAYYKGSTSGRNQLSIGGLGFKIFLGITLLLVILFGALFFVAT